MRRPQTTSSWLSALAWCGVLAVVGAEIAPVLGAWNRQVVGPFGGIDAIFQAGLLEWSRAGGGSAAWTTTPTFFPVTGTIAFMDSLWGQALLIAPLRWLGVTAPASQYNAAYLGSLLLAATAMAALWRAGGGRFREAGVAAAALLGSPYCLSQLGHLNQLPMPFVLLAAAALIAALGVEGPASRLRRHGPWWLLAGALVAQGAWGWYGFAYAAILCASIAATWIVSSWRAARAAHADGTPALRAWRLRLGAHALRAVLPLALAGVGIAHLSGPYRDMHRRYPEFERSRIEVRYDSANLQHFFEGGAYRLHAADLIGRGPRGDARHLGKDRQVLWFGGIATALAVLGFVRRHRLSPRQRQVGLALLVAGAAGLVLAFGDSVRLPATQARLPLPFDGLRELVPSFKAFRAVWRFSFLTVVAVAWWAAVGWQALAGGGAGRDAGVHAGGGAGDRARGGAGGGRWALALGALLLLVAESLPCQLPAVELGFDGIRRPLTTVPDGPLLTLPAPHTEYDEDATEAAWLLWALETGRRVTGGASGWMPPETSELRRLLYECENDDRDAAALLDRMRSQGIVGAVIVARPGDDRRVAFWRRELAAAGAVRAANPGRDDYEVYRWPVEGTTWTRHDSRTLPTSASTSSTGGS